jgi:hypothetical protein
VAVQYPDEVPENLKIYPDPVYRYLNLHYTLNGSKAFLSIINLEGKNLLNETLSKGKSIHKIDVGFLPSGLYFIRLRDNGKMITGKFLKN